MADYRLSIDGPVARITLCAPERHNALSQDTIRALTDTLGDIDADTALRVLILQAEGKSFCAGADLGNVAAQDWSENPLTALCDRLERLRPPTICALQGGVYGGGVELAIACDFRIGVATMKMFAPPAELGIHYPPEGLARAERLLGLQMTRRIFLLAERFDAAALAATPFLDEMVEPEALEPRVAALATRIAGLAPLAVEGMKASLHPEKGGDPGAARARIAACFASADHAEALAARKEKRAPVFHRN